MICSYDQAVDLELLVDHLQDTYQASTVGDLDPSTRGKLVFLVSLF